LFIDGQFVGHDFVTDRAPLPVGESLDVEKDRLTPTVRRDEPKALIVFPSCDSALVSHDTDAAK
jgi:hypothetical protein